MNKQTDSNEEIDSEIKAHHKVGMVEHFIEPRLFGHRLPVLIFFLLASILFGWHATTLRPDASFQKMVPIFHPYIANYLKYENELRPLGNIVRISVETTKGDIYNKDYLDTLKKITDEVFYIPGVDRGNMKSLWTPNVVWMQVTEAGMTGGQIIPQGFDGSPETLEQVRAKRGTVRAHRQPGRCRRPFDYRAGAAGGNRSRYRRKTRLRHILRQTRKADPREI